jgi:hypothetical protein
VSLKDSREFGHRSAKLAGRRYAQAPSVLSHAACGDVFMPVGRLNLMRTHQQYELTTPHKVRFWAKVSEEPEVEVALV